jgi:hypothetical protein
MKKSAPAKAIKKAVAVSDRSLGKNAKAEVGKVAGIEKKIIRKGK